MSTIKTATTALTAALLVSGIGLAWAQTEDAQQPSEPTTPVAAMPSEQTPADPNAVPLTDNSAAMPAQQTAPTNPPAVDGTTPAPLSSDANSQAPQSTTATMDNSTSVTPMPDASRDEPAPRADRN
jgi:hypothetical protein